MATPVILLASEDTELLYRIEKVIRAASPFTPIAKCKVTKIEPTNKQHGCFNIAVFPLGEAPPTGVTASHDAGPYTSNWPDVDLGGEG